MLNARRPAADREFFPEKPGVSNERSGPSYVRLRVHMPEGLSDREWAPLN